jgi:hypothetical protein
MTTSSQEAVMAEPEVEALIARCKAGENIFNNFHGHFPRGYKRRDWADDVHKWLSRDISLEESDDWVQDLPDLLATWAAIDKELLRLGYSLAEVKTWGQDELMSEHLELVAQIYVHLTKSGFTKIRG